MIQLNAAKRSKCFPSAFTLIELMIVMVVISIMVGITIPVSRYVTLRARQANQRIYIEKIKSALEDYRAAYGEYPITPVTNAAGQVINYADAARHYPANYATECYYTSNSPNTNVCLAINTLEIISATKILTNDYCLTYPLMLRQRAEGARPFMEFKDVTVAFLVYIYSASDEKEYTRFRKSKSGSVIARITKGIFGNPINRAKAIDPVSQCQWKYSSEDGVTYSLTTNSF